MQKARGALAPAAPVVPASLGPLFFLLYINDLPHCLNKTKPPLFAGDTNLTASVNSMTDLETAVNSDLENLRKWLIAYKLSLNLAKT
jgi:hypothetical protein